MIFRAAIPLSIVLEEQSRADNRKTPGPAMTLRGLNSAQLQAKEAIPCILLASERCQRHKDIGPAWPPPGADRLTATLHQIGLI